MARDPSLWEAVQRSGRAHQDFEAKAASWTHAELMGALDELLFGEIKRGRKRALTRALRQHPRRIRPALLEMPTAGAFREAFESGGRLETACEFLGNTPPPEAVEALGVDEPGSLTVEMSRYLPASCRP